jgi:hypothetical protein
MGNLVWIEAFAEAAINKNAASNQHLYKHGAISCQIRPCKALETIKFKLGHRLPASCLDAAS